MLKLSESLNTKSPKLSKPSTVFLHTEAGDVLLMLRVIVCQHADHELACLMVWQSRMPAECPGKRERERQRERERERVCVCERARGGPPRSVQAQGGRLDRTS